jgi:hypothetical protein
MVSSAEKKDILVPLTSSLYVRGKLSSPDKVIVDVGTGFYVEKVRFSTAVRGATITVASSSPGADKAWFDRMRRALPSSTMRKSRS